MPGGREGNAMSTLTYVTNVSLSVDTTDPDLAPLVDAVKDADEQNVRRARASLLMALALNEAQEHGYQRGHRDGCDEGAQPYLDGPWWKRAWTAARS